MKRILLAGLMAAGMMAAPAWASEPAPGDGARAALDTAPIRAAVEDNRLVEMQRRGGGGFRGGGFRGGGFRGGGFRGPGFAPRAAFVGGPRFVGPRVIGRDPGFRPAGVVGAGPWGGWGRQRWVGLGWRPGWGPRPPFARPVWVQPGWGWGFRPGWGWGWWPPVLIGSAVGVGVVAATAPAWADGACRRSWAINEWGQQVLVTRCCSFQTVVDDWGRAFNQRVCRTY